MAADGGILADLGEDCGSFFSFFATENPEGQRKKGGQNFI